ncbi:hypothetical protein KR026_010018 [Drosophila bipectinata]|nr:hypothetical protein KR026_010018 [Drosophila bipectinata]
MFQWLVWCLLLPVLTSAKVFDRCELAHLLQHRFGLPAPQVATLVCIAQHSSDFNTAAFGGGAGLGGGSHGLFQISDVYWCSPPGQGKGCGVSCARLRDDDIADDVLCVRKIYAEHQRISGDGFTAWQAYAAYCKDPGSYVAGCGVQQGGAGSLAVASSYQRPQQVQVHSYPASNHYQQVTQIQPQGKIYSRCELAQELYYQHKLPMPQIPTWVCIAQHESSFNTAAVGRLNADGSADHGLFQISDLFWCTHDQQGGKGCHATCNQFLDSSIADDVQCIRRIHQEHTQISGDGFNAWTVYKRNCLNQHYEQVAACFAKPPAHHHQHPNAIGGGASVKPKVSYAYQFGQVQVQQQNQYYRPPVTPTVSYQREVSSYQGNPFLRPRLPVSPAPPRQHPNAIGGGGFKGQTPANPFYSLKQPQYQTTHYQTHYTQQQPQQYHTTYTRTGKVYNRCELAQELYFSHKFPMQDIATWVCIAEHESSFNTAAVGRLNADGSADHGLFQISDLFWCTHGGGSGGKGCHIDCNRLLDSDISDDVKCIRTIHEEHTRLSGDGFTAWTVYNGHCRQKTRADIASCFEGKDLTQEKDIKPHKPQINDLVKKTPAKPKGKIYNRCELAKELYHKHRMPMKEIPTWVCIAQHESSFNTAAVGRLNADGSADHGLFQISDLYWCSHDQSSGKACHIECDSLLDSDISDDVKCIRTIHEEHTRLSGDGFNAWTVYNGHCRGQSLAQLSDCFDGNEISKAEKVIPIVEKPEETIVKSQNYVGNPFLQNLQGVKINQNHVQPPKVTNKITNIITFPQEPQKPTNQYAANPFLQNFQAQKGSSSNQAKPKPLSTPPAPTTPTQKPNYDNNPFLKAPGSIAQSVITPHPAGDSFSYAQNPFLSLLSKPIVPAQAPIKSRPKPSQPPASRPYVSSDSFRNEVIKFTATSTTASTPTTRQPISTSGITKQSVTTATKRPFTAATSKPVSSTAKTTSLPPWSWQASGRSTTTARPATAGSGNRYTATTKPSPAPTRSSSTTRPTTRTTPYTTTRPSTQPTTTPINRPKTTTSRPTTRPITQYISTTRPTIQYISTTRQTSTTTRPTTRPTIQYIPTTRQTSTIKTTTRSLGFYIPTSQPIKAGKTTSTYVQTTRQPTTRPSTTRAPTTRSTTTYQPTTRKTTRQPTNHLPTTRFTTTPPSTTRPTTTRFTTTRPSTTRPTTTRFTTARPPTTRSPYNYIAVNQPTRQPVTTRLPSTRYPTTRQSSTTPRPYIFTSTTAVSKISTTKDPFDHPFFQKFKAKFEKTTSNLLQNGKTTTTIPKHKNETTSSPYYAKYQENKAKKAAKTVLSYEIGQNRTTTSRPASVFDVYRNWNKKN